MQGQGRGSTRKAVRPHRRGSSSTVRYLQVNFAITIWESNPMDTPLLAIYVLAAVCASAGLPRPAVGERSAPRPAGPSGGERRSAGGAVIAPGAGRYLRVVREPVLAAPLIRVRQA